MKKWIARILKGRSASGGRSGGVGLVLLYHRITTPARDPQALSVSPANFSQHVETLKQIAVPMDLEEMTHCVLTGKDLPERAIAISFDDGYSDNIENAEPILREAGVSGTVFVSSGFAEEQTPFWWDRVEEVFLGVLPAGRYRFMLPNDHLDLEFDAPPIMHDHWTALIEEIPSDRHRAYMNFMSHLKGLSPDAMTVVLQDLEARVGLERRASATARAATPHELKASARRGVLKFQAHTRDHPQLTSMPPGEQYKQIRRSYRDLARWTGKRPKYFAYPYGSSVDFDSKTQSAVKKAGFAAAFANIPGLVGADTPRWAIPRVLVRNIDQDAFRRQIEWSFNHLPTPRRQ